MLLPESLQAYLASLGLEAPKALDIDFVTALQTKHVGQYSFNSLAVVLGQEINLELDAISEKIVNLGLGGYCFEHNKLSYELLKALGYNVKLTLARVLNNYERDVARTHRVTLLTIDEATYLIDTGFGAHGPTGPLRLSYDGDQSIGSDIYRIFPHGDQEFDLKIIKDGSYFTLYRFDLAFYSDADCELGNFYSHKHSKAVFVNNFMFSIKTMERRVSLVNHVFTIREGNVEEHNQHITSPLALQALLNETFDTSLDIVVVEHLFDRFLAPELEKEAS